MPKKFEWPCAKRKAHGPHPDPDALHNFDCDADQDDVDCGCGIECPGVKAHPATMIGGRLLP